jgi:hypothetical protein
MADVEDPAGIKAGASRAALFDVDPFHEMAWTTLLKKTVIQKARLPVILSPHFDGAQQASAGIDCLR